MAPKKAKLAGNRADSHDLQDGNGSNKDGSDRRQEPSLVAAAQIADLAATAALPPVPIPPPPSPTLTHKNIHVNFDSVPTVIYSPDRPSDREWMSLRAVKTTDDSVNQPTFSDQTGQRDVRTTKRTIVIPKHPHRTAEMEKTLAGVRAAHVAHFALSQDALNALPSVEDLTFEDPVVAAVLPATVQPTEKDKGDTGTVIAEPRKPSVGVTDPIILGIEAERTFDLIEAKDEEDLYLPKQEIVSESPMEPKPSLTEGLTDTIADRHDMKVFYELFPFPKSEFDPCSLLQVSVAKRKKKLVLDPVATYPVTSPSYSTVVASEKQAAAGKGGHEGSSKQKKNLPSGHSSPLVTIPISGIPMPSEGGAMKDGHLKGPGKSKGEKPEYAPASDGKANALAPAKPGSDGAETNQATSKLDLQTGGFGANRAVTPALITGSDSLSPIQSPEVPPKPLVKPRVRTQSWDKFFGPVGADEGIVDITESGTGFDNVRGPTGLRKQFVEDEKNSGFFRQLLDKLVSEWVGQNSTPASKEHAEFRWESFPSPPLRQPARPPKHRKEVPTYPPLLLKEVPTYPPLLLKEVPTYPSLLLKEVLPVVRKTAEEGGTQQAAFAGAAEVYMEKLKQLQRVNFPRYDRGPQQTQLPIPGMAFEKMDRTVGILQRHWIFSPSKPTMRTYQSQLYPNYDPAKEHHTTEVPVVRYYAPLTCAKDVEYDPADYHGVSGAPLAKRFTTTEQLQKTDSALLAAVLAKQTQHRSAMRSREQSHLPVTPRPVKPGPHVAFSYHRKAPYKEKSKPDTFGRVSVNVVRRLNGNHWPEKFLPKQRKGAKVPRYMEDTENWSVYLATQAKLVEAMKRKAVNDARKLRDFNPAEERYCKQPRVDRRERYVPPKKPPKKQVRIRWNRLMSNRSFTGVRCLRLQKPLAPIPKYPHAPGPVPELLAHHGPKNPLWTGLGDYVAEVALREAEKVHFLADPKVTEPELAKMAVTMSAKPGEGVRATSAGFGGPSHSGLKGVASGMFDYEKKSKLALNKSRIQDSGKSPLLVENPVPSVPPPPDGNLSIAVPVKSAAKTFRGAVAKYMKTAEVANALDNRTGRVLSAEAAANPAAGSGLRPQQGGQRSSPVLALTPELPNRAASDWENDPDPHGMETFTFAQIPPDFRWDLLNCNTNLDVLAEDAKESCSKLSGVGVAADSPKLRRAAPKSLIDLEISSLKLLGNSHSVADEPSSHSFALKQRLAEKEQKADRERQKRALPLAPLPDYMLRRPRKINPSPGENKRSSSPDSKAGAKRERPTGPMAGLLFLFDEVNASVRDEVKVKIEKNDVAEGGALLETADEGLHKHRSNHAGSPSNMANRLPRSQEKFHGQSLTGLGKENLVHPRLQRSLILRQKREKKQPTSASVGRGKRSSVSKRVSFEMCGGGDDDNENTNYQQATDIKTDQTKHVKERSKFDGKGSMFVSTVKTMPRKTLPRVQMRGQNRCNTPFFVDYEKAAGIEITREVDSFSKLQPNQSAKNYAMLQSTRRKYGPVNPASIPKRDPFILNDNFWRRRPPFIVAVKPVLGKNILPNLRHYLRTVHESVSSKTRLPQGFVLQGEVGFTLRPRNELDAADEFQRNGGKEERDLNMVQRCLRKRVLDRLAHFIPDTTNLRGTLSLQKLRLFELEPLELKRQRLVEEWKREQQSICGAELLYKTPGQRALLAFQNKARSRLRIERLIRRYTGEYRYSHMSRAILKAKLNIPSSAAKKPEVLLESVPVVPEKSAETLNIDRLATAKPKKSPMNGKTTKRLVPSDVESDGDGTPANDHREPVLATPGGQSTGSKQKQSAFGRSVPSSGAKDKSKAGGTKEAAESVHKIGSDQTSTKFPGAAEKHVEQPPPEQRSEAALDQRNAAETSMLDDDSPPWWKFNPEDYFSTHPSAHPDDEQKEPSLFASQKEPSLFASQKEPNLFPSQKEPSLFVSQKEPSLFVSQKEPSLFPSQKEPSLFVSQKEPNLFASQMTITGHLPNAVALLAEPPSLTFQEQSLLDMIYLLKSKLQADPKFRKILEDGSKALGEGKPAGERMEPDSVNPAPEKPPRPDSMLAPESIKKTVRNFQDIGSGTLENLSNVLTGPATSSQFPDPSDLHELHQSLKLLHKDHLQLHDHHDHHHDHHYDDHHDDHHNTGNHPSQSRDIKRWVDTLAEVSQEIVQTSCHVDLGQDNYIWQLPQIVQLRRKAAQRYGSEVILAKLLQLQLAYVDEEYPSKQSYRTRMGIIAKGIQDHTEITSLSEMDAFRNKLAGLILQLELAKLNVKYHAELAIRSNQRQHNQASVAAWNRSIKGGPNSRMGLCGVRAMKTVERTPPQSPPRNQSPTKLKTEVVVEAPNDEEGNAKDKKGKGDKNAEKGKGLKKSKDAVKGDEKKGRIGSENVSKGPGKKTSENLQSGAVGVSDGKTKFK
ncbi:hypothetical protein BV898_10584 [Hypsibius exemplaris]|uniref:Uncharacterized protein n=1 Tax=Hypsibius exemplaris TaxID=2072580 RepID=A0A1W0WJ04_HYPEX|nr:hypothetical protein BV898_10584 [Hypsibius exemplaris]